MTNIKRYQTLQINFYSNFANFLAIAKEMCKNPFSILQRWGVDREGWLFCNKPEKEANLFHSDLRLSDFLRHVNSQQLKRLHKSSLSEKMQMVVTLRKENAGLTHSNIQLPTQTLL